MILCGVSLQDRHGARGAPFFCVGSAKTAEQQVATKLSEAAPGFEPGMEDLQSSALPLGHAAEARAR